MRSIVRRSQKVRDKLATADAKLGAAIRKACAALLPASLFAGAGLGADVVEDACGARGVDPAGTLDGLVACQTAVTACAVVDVVETKQPRLAQLLALAPASSAVPMKLMNQAGSPKRVKTSLRIRRSSRGTRRC